MSPATVPSSPSSPRKLLYIPSGLIVGLIVGLAWAFAKDRKDKRSTTCAMSSDSATCPRC